MAHSSETYEQVVQFLFGDGAYETFGKSSPQGSDLATTDRKNRRQAQIGLASNGLGIAAGAAGLGAAVKDLKSTEPGPVTGKLLRYAKTSKGRGRLIQVGAGGAVALQGANLVGDAVANRVLARAAKKKDVSKGLLDKDPRKKWADGAKQGIPMPAGGQLVRLAANQGPTTVARGKQAVELTKPVAVKAKEKLKKSDEIDFKLDAEISKVDTDKRQVFGWASIVEKDGQPVVDLQGDYISVEEIEKAAYAYVQNSRKGGDMHRRNGDEPHHVSDMIESFIVTPEKKEKLGLPDSMPVGWWVGYQIHDDETWNLVKSGQRTGFSIHGKGKRKELS